LIINSDDPQTQAYISELVRLMTQPGAEGDFEVIRLQNADASDAARTIDEFFNPRPPQGQQPGGFGFPGGFGPFGGGRGFGPGGFGPGGFPGAPGMMTPGAAATAASAANAANQPKPSTVRVVADPNSNSLLVRASPIEMLTVKALVKTID